MQIHIKYTQNRKCSLRQVSHITRKNYFFWHKMYIALAPYHLRTRERQTHKPLHVISKAFKVLCKVQKWFQYMYVFHREMNTF